MKGELMLSHLFLNKRTFGFFLILCGSSWGFLSHSVCAAIDEQPQAANTVYAEDLIKPAEIKFPMVTGSRLPSFQIPFANVPANVSYIAANVSVKNKEGIRSTYPKTLQEALQDTESAVLFDTVGNGLDTTFSLRGFNRSDALVVLVDGVRVNEADGGAVVFPLIRTSYLESIQIDRGSSSHIYGDGAFGGVIHITTGQASKNPLSVFGGLEFSSHQGARFYQGLSGTLKDDWTPLGGKWSYYFKGGRDAGDGFRNNGEYRITDFDMKTAYEFSDNRGFLHVAVKHVDDAVSNPGEMTANQFQTDPTRTNKPLDGRKFKNTTASIGSDINFLDERLTLSLFSSWRKQQIQLFTTSGAFTDFTSGSNPDTDFVSTDARQSDFIWQLNYVDDWQLYKTRSYLGMELRDASNMSIEKNAFNGIILKNAIVETERHADINNVGIFGRHSVEFEQGISGYVGMRHDQHWLKTRDFLAPTSSISRRWSQTSLSTGLSLKITDSANLFFNYSQGFKVPTIDDIAPFSGTVSQNLEPVKSDSYEIGTRINLPNKGLLKASYFLIDLEDEIIFDATSVGPTAPFGQNVNLGSSRRTGIELRIELNPLKEIDLYGSYTWMQAWNRATNPAGTLPDDRALGQVPEQRATWGITVKPFERVGTPLDGFRLSLNGRYTGRQHPQAYETTGQGVLNATGGAGHIIKAFTIWDFLAAYTWKQSEVYFKVTNLFNNGYYSRAVAATSFGTAIYPAGSFAFVNSGAPREYTAGVTWKFG